MRISPYSGRFQAFIAPARERPAIWRLAVGLALIAVCYLGLNLGAYALLAAIAGRHAAADAAVGMATASTPAAALILLATFVPLILGVFLATWIVHRVSPLTLFGPLERLLPDFLRGSGAMAAIIVPLFALWSVFWDTLPNLPLHLWAILLPLTLCGVLLQTLAEELVFRAYLIQRLAVRTTWRLIWFGLPAISFAALHYDPSRLGEGAVAGPIAAFAFALVATDLTLRSGGLGMAWGLHFANNIAAIAFVSTGPVLSGLALRASPYGPETLVESPLLLVVELIPLLVAWVFLRRRMSR